MPDRAKCGKIFTNFVNLIFVNLKPYVTSNLSLLSSFVTQEAKSYIYCGIILYLFPIVLLLLLGFIVFPMMIENFVVATTVAFPKHK